MSNQQLVVKLHANEGNPCANPLCRRPLITGKIHAGIYCDRNKCGPRGLAGMVTAKRKAEHAKRQEHRIGDNEDEQPTTRPASEGLPDLDITVEEHQELHTMDQAVLAAQVEVLEGRLVAAKLAAENLERRLLLTREALELKALSCVRQVQLALLTLPRGRPHHPYSLHRSHRRPRPKLLCLPLCLPLTTVTTS